MRSIFFTFSVNG